ncbi:S41 family peptidase [Fusobacterium sp. PH5-44]|uniref:S41 family peptidase n=1 Tax=unclassified Fusobacterium TaxID=2648384 RepID=UPI003D23A183
MINFIKIKKMAAIASILVFGAGLLYGKNTNANQPNTKNEDSFGFLSNLRELKEISDIMDIISGNYVNEKGIDRKKLMQGAIRGMMESLDDPHSNYFTMEELKDFQDDIKGKYVGVGMVIQKKKNEPLLVVSPIEDAPAYKVGIKPKDQIIAIDGESTYNMTSEESVKKLKGAPKTNVKVTVYREITKETKEITIERAEVVLKYVKHKMLEGNDKIGYLRLTQFGDNVYPDMAKALEDLQKQGMEGLVLDLRSNPGGALDQAIKISSMFIKEGRIVSTKTKTGQEEIHNREGKYYGDFPLAILINGGSASASEIVSGAIKDYKRGVLVGEKSFGKGSVQTLIPLPDGDGIKLTIAKYYTPNEISIHGTGIEPDVKVEEKEGYMLFEGVGSVINIDETTAKENRKELIKEIKGEEAAKEFDEHKDIQLDAAVEEVKKLLSKKSKPAA